MNSVYPATPAVSRASSSASSEPKTKVPVTGIPAYSGPPSSTALQGKAGVFMDKGKKPIRLSTQRYLNLGFPSFGFRKSSSSSEESSYKSAELSAQDSDMMIDPIQLSPHTSTWTCAYCSYANGALEKTVCAMCGNDRGKNDNVQVVQDRRSLPTSTIVSSTTVAPSTSVRTVSRNNSSDIPVLCNALSSASDIVDVNDARYNGQSASPTPCPTPHAPSREQSGMSCRSGEGGVAVVPMNPFDDHSVSSRSTATPAMPQTARFETPPAIMGRRASCPAVSAYSQVGTPYSMHSMETLVRSNCSTTHSMETPVHSNVTTTQTYQRHPPLVPQDYHRVAPQRHASGPITTSSRGIVMSPQGALSFHVPQGMSTTSPSSFASAVLMSKEPAAFASTPSMSNLLLPDLRRSSSSSQRDKRCKVKISATAKTPGNPNVDDLLPPLFDAVYSAGTDSLDLDETGNRTTSTEGPNTVKLARLMTTAMLIVVVCVSIGVGVPLSLDRGSSDPSLSTSGLLNRTADNETGEEAPTLDLRRPTSAPSHRPSSTYIEKPEDGETVWFPITPPLEGTTATSRLGSLLAVNGDGSVVAVTEADRSGALSIVRVFQVAPGLRVLELGEGIRQQGILSLTMSSNGHVLAIGLDDGSVTVFKCNSTSAKPTWVEVGDKVVSPTISSPDRAVVSDIALSEDGSYMAMGTVSGNNRHSFVQILGYNEERREWLRRGGSFVNNEDQNAFVSVDLSADGSIFAFSRCFGGESSLFGKVEVLEVSRDSSVGWRKVGQLLAFALAKVPVALSSDGSILAVSGNMDTRVYSLDRPNGKWRQRSKGLPSSASVLLSDSGGRLALASKTGTSVWGTHGGVAGASEQDLTNIFSSSSDVWSTVALAGDGTRVVLGRPGNASGDVLVMEATTVFAF